MSSNFTSVNSLESLFSSLSEFSLSVSLLFSESFSVIIQILFYKYSKNKSGVGKRFFKMAPLHHHYELLGWAENHVVVRFWIIGIILALFSLTTFKIR